MLLIALLSLFAGVITVLSPCVLPFLPVIVGGSLTGDRKRPFIVALSLFISLLIFTFLLKASSLFLHLDQHVWMYISGGLVILLGIFMLFPSLWARISVATGWDKTSHKLLDSAQKQKNSWVSAILTGAALGPVFSSCSPTYAWVIATILPSNTTAGLFYLGLYSLGLVASLLIISIIGQKIVSSMGWAVNPRGWFQKTIAIIFIIVGLLVATGIDQKVQTWAVSNLPGFEQLEQSLIPGGQKNITDKKQANADSAAKDNTAKNNTDKKQDSDVDESQYVTAPEIQGIAHWINSNPLTLKQLRGKVVLLDFWTYSCINCLRTQPYLNSWYKTYKKDGLVIIGIHSPEFAFEKVQSNVEEAVKKENIKYPVAMDNDFATWRAYYNQYWPAKYLIDKNGKVRYYHFGEGAYGETEYMIKKLLMSNMDAPAPPELKLSQYQSPETYLGVRRAQGFEGSPYLAKGSQQYSPANTLQTNGWTLSGKWNVDDEKITAEQDNNTLTYQFVGRDVYLVMGGPIGAKVKVELEGAHDPGGEDVHNGEVTIDAHRLYHLVRRKDDKTPAKLKITFPREVSANAFTFG